MILESEEKYRTLVELSPDMIVIHQDGKFVYANAATVAMLGREPSLLIGMDVFPFIDPGFHGVVRKNTSDDLEGTPTPTTEIQVKRDDGTVMILEGKGKRIQFGGRPAVQVVLRDVTDRMKAELQLREYTTKLRRSNEDLELFAYIATHDLQEPIRGIVAYSQLLLGESANLPDSRFKKYLKNIESDGLRMNSLVSDLRNYLRVRSGAKPFAPTDMEEIFAATMDYLQPEIGKTRAVITHDPLPVIHSDGIQMVQVMQNLLGNAIKFHQQSIPPEIHVTAHSYDGTWQFAVRDTGIGIPEEYHDKIFVLFERLHTRDSYPGTGLGLALCRRIIERHGGRIWVDSEPAKGSTFYFTIPQKPHEPSL